MNTWQKWIASLMMVCVIQVGWVNAAEKTPASSPGTELAEELAAALAELNGGLLTTDARTQRIALLVARITQFAPSHSPSILAGFSRQMVTSDLDVISAAAVISAGSGSPAVLKAMVEAQGEDPSRTRALHQGAVNPIQVLGNQVAAMMQPIELQPAPVAVAARVAPPEAVAAATPVAAAPAGTEAAPPVIVTASAAPQPPPPQPPGLPPRPPALPYRGQ